MITAREVAYATYGAWRLARFDPQAMRFFDNTPEAFWRSFYAAPIVAPAFAVLVTLRLNELGFDSSMAHILLVQTISYVVDWFAFPFVMLYLAELLDRQENYLRFIAARNWATVLQIALFLVIAAIGYGGLVGPGVAIALSIAATIAILVYQWFIARVGLDIRAPAAAAIVFLDLIIGILLNTVTMRLL